MITSPTMMGALRDAADNGVFSLVGTTAPLSGTSGTGVGIAGLGCVYTNLTNGVQYVNEGTATSPYWTPTTLRNRNLLAWDSDFRTGAGKAVADTAALLTLADSGIKVFGNDVAQTDSGFVVAIGLDGAIGTLTASATDGLLAALGVGLTTSVPFKPSSHGPLNVDALFAVNSALTSRRVFMGFVGTAADALANPVTGSTTTITLVQDDVAGVLMDSGLTAATELFGPHNKADEAATIATSGIDCGVVMPAAGTYVRLRVEISATGQMTIFKDKVQVLQVSAASSTSVALAPVLLVGSKASATKAILVKHFAAWGTRN